MLGDVQGGSRMKFGAGATTFLWIVGACCLLHKGSECAQRLQFKGRWYYEVNETRHGVGRVVVELEDGKELIVREKDQQQQLRKAGQLAAATAKTFRGKSRAFNPWYTCIFHGGETAMQSHFNVTFTGNLHR